MNTSSNSSNIVWSMNCTTSSNYDPTVYNSVITSSSNNINISYIIKRCRKCNHAHAQENGSGCYDVIGDSVTFVLCNCKEHVPTDNLEYLEYLIKKKESL